jgi:hypothetical protein
MRIVEAELDAVQVRMPNPWSLVESPEEFWAHLGTHDRQLLKTLLEGALVARRDEWVRVDWHEPAAGRRTCRNGYYRRKRWDTKLGPLRDRHVPRCRERGLTRRMSHHSLRCSGNPWAGALRFYRRTEGFSIFWRERGCSIPRPERRAAQTRDQ